MNPRAGRPPSELGALTSCTQAPPGAMPTRANTRFPTTARDCEHLMLSDTACLELVTIMAFAPQKLCFIGYGIIYILFPWKRVRLYAKGQVLLS